MPWVSGDTSGNGFGKYRWDDGRTYEGQWRGMKQDGTGTFTWADGATYELSLIHI